MPSSTVCRLCPALQWLGRRALQQQACCPLRICGRKRRFKWLGVVEIDRITPGFVNAIDERLEIQQHITVRRPKGDWDRFQSFRERQAIRPACLQLIGAADPSLIRRASGGLESMQWHDERTVAVACEVDLDQIDPTFTALLLFLSVLRQPFSRPLVGRIHELDDRDDTPALPPVVRPEFRRTIV